jgi:hypothetical protein
MCSATDNPVSCEIHAVIHFLHANNMNDMEIHHELCTVYSQTVMCEGNVRQLCRMFKERQTNVHDEGQSSRLATYSE